MNLKTFFAGLLTAAFFTFAVPFAAGQHGGGAPAAPAIASSASKDPSSMSGLSGQANFNQMMNEQTGSMHFAGKVVIEGSALPWDPIPVQIKCDGKVRDYDITDKRGAFDIKPTPTESFVARSARDPKKVDPTQFVGCQVSAVLDGFDSSSLTIANRSLTDDPDIGTITLRGDAQSKGSIVSTTLASAPSDAVAEMSKARTDKLNDNMGGAKRHLQKAVSIDPQLAEGWFQLGKIEVADKPQDALSAFQKAAAADPKYSPPYEYIAELSATAKKWQDVVDAANHALQLNPRGTPQIWYWSAVGNYNIGDKELAETAALTALSMDPRHKVAPTAEDELAVIQAARGKYKDALDHVRKCLTYTPPGPAADSMKQQEAQLEKFVPKTAQ
jgi:tetratricopeptide (TPR) repeat protein